LTVDTLSDAGQLFLSGGEIWPDRVEGRYPGAQFVTNAVTSVEGSTVAPAFAGRITDEVWGILVRVPKAEQGGAAIRVRTSEGAEHEAVSPSIFLGGDPEDVLATAMYWELPPTFVSAVREALAATGTIVEDEEPRDDANLS
jgi:hypothetical protein